jgi:hypothetical protein
MRHDVNLRIIPFDQPAVVPDSLSGFCGHMRVRISDGPEFVFSANAGIEL